MEECMIRTTYLISIGLSLVLLMGCGEEKGPYEKGMAYYRSGEIGKAILELKKAAEQDSTMEVCSNLGAMLYNEEKAKDAITLFCKAVEVDPSSVVGRRNLAFAYAEKGVLNRAIQEYEAAIRLDTQDAESCYNLALVYHRREELDRSIAYNEMAVARDPRFVEAYVNLGFDYVEQGMVDRAGKSFEKAMEIDPKCAGATYGLALTYEAKGQSAEARSWWQKYLRLEPKGTWAYKVRERLEVDKS
jgi:tetratricopeptide (TPR) repeat protein